MVDVYFVREPRHAPARRTNESRRNRKWMAMASVGELGCMRFASYRANPDAVDDVTSYTCMATVTNVVEEQIIGEVSQ
jgi:hypothetical protein